MDLLAWLAMGAAVTVSAHGEWRLAVDCGFGSAVAAGLPLALDPYALRALRAGREVFPPVLGMIATNAAAHLLGAGVIHQGWPLIVAVSAIAPLVLWRVHVLHATTPTAPAALPEVLPEDDLPSMWADPVPAVPGTYPDPVPAVSAVPGAYPAAVDEPAEVAPAALPELEFWPLPARPVSAAEPERTRPDTADEYVPDGPGYTEYPDADQQEDAGEPDELTPDAAEKFADVLAAGRLPAVRTLRSEYGIGQPRAQRVRDALRALAETGQVTV